MAGFDPAAHATTDGVGKRRRVAARSLDRRIL